MFAPRGASLKERKYWMLVEFAVLLEVVAKSLYFVTLASGDYTGIMAAAMASSAAALLIAGNVMLSSELNRTRAVCALVMLLALSTPLWTR